MVEKKHEEGMPAPSDSSIAGRRSVGSAIGALLGAAIIVGVTQ